MTRRTTRRRSLGGLTATLLAATLALTVGPAVTAQAAPAPASAPAATTAGASLGAATPALATQARKKKKRKKAVTKPRRSQTVQGGSLTYGPRSFVGGQGLVFSGRLPRAGAQRIVLQQHMGRAGDGWFAVPGFAGTTAADGTFRFAAPAPGMFNIKYRVVAPGRGVTPGVNMVAKTQDALVTVSGQRSPGRPFRVSVDTTPTLDRRPDVRGTPVFTGRPLTLQSRVHGGAWANLATTTVGSDGMGHFNRTERAGTHVYRVVQGAIRSGATALGATPSFPTYVTVGSSSARTLSPATSLASRWADWSSAAGSRVGATQRSLSGRTASSSFKWGAMLWDFAWERGEGLADGPYRGTAPRGSWTDYTDGTGRAHKHNGGLMLDSGRNSGAVDDDFGTTMATMQGNGAAYGRWETRLRVKAAQRGALANDYKLRAELVPADPADYACGRFNILVGELRAHGSTLAIGAKKGAGQWAATRQVGNQQHSAPALAVEVQRTHITWYFGGRPVGTLGAGAVSGKPMTLRLSMVGNGTQEMNATQLISDWQRGFKAEPGASSRAGGSLPAVAASGGC